MVVRCFFCLFLLSFMICLYILEIKPLLVALFANIFSHSVGCLFILFKVSFDVQELVSVLGSICLFLLYFFCLGKLTQEHTGTTDFRECSAYVLYEFYGLRSLSV